MAQSGLSETSNLFVRFWGEADVHRRAASSDVRRAEPFRHDALEAKLATYGGKNDVARSVIYSFNCSTLRPS
jgi:hypothetical protein